MDRPLDRAELAAAANTLIRELWSNGDGYSGSREIARIALRDIAKRALEQAARPTAITGELIVGDAFPPVRLSDACAALDAPKDPTRGETLLSNEGDARR